MRARVGFSTHFDGTGGRHTIRGPSGSRGVSICTISCRHGSLYHAQPCVCDGWGCGSWDSAREFSSVETIMKQHTKVPNPHPNAAARASDDKFLHCPGSGRIHRARVVISRPRGIHFVLPVGTDRPSKVGLRSRILQGLFLPGPRLVQQGTFPPSTIIGPCRLGGADDKGGGTCSP